MAVGRTDQLLRGFGDYLVAGGLVRRADSTYDICRDITRFRVQFHDNSYAEFALSNWELQTGGRDGFREWTRHLHRAIECRAQATVRLDMLYGFTIPRERIFHGEPSIADATAEKLFKETAPMVYREISKNGWAAIVGSEGTKYKLHKCVSYCIERVSDRARLCAVVPGVPLWDHLLGVKLMVERDELKFLETANVARA